jgi:hypothetical protein
MGVNTTDTPDATTYGQVEDESFSVEDRPTQSPSSQTTVQSGWEAAEKLVPAMTDFPTEFKHSESFQLIRFIDIAGPFANYRQHFLKEKTEGRRSYIWDGSGPQDPLAELLNSKPEVKRAFSIVNLTAKPYQRQILIATPRLYKTLHAAEFSPQGPLTKSYWAISRTGIKQQTVYNLMAVKARDLQEDWGLNPDEVEAAIADFKPFDRSAIREDSYEALLEVAKSLI